jgi:FtsP/CotA-like multicopper oxidase with cupredoxin domain
MPPSPVSQTADPARRRTLQVGVATAAAGLAASTQVATPVSAKDLPKGPHTTSFAVKLPLYPPKQPLATALNPLPGDLPALGEAGRGTHQHWLLCSPQRFYEMDVRAAQHSFHPELPNQTIWGYDGRFPGPTFVERYGVPTVVRIRNSLPANAFGFGSPDISTHLHNMHTASESDGFPGDYFSETRWGPTGTTPGSFRDHLYPNYYAGFTDPRYAATYGDPREALGTLWFHDHRLDFTASNVYRGLASFYLLFDHIDSGDERDPSPTALRLPSGVGTYDIPLMLTDVQMDYSGYLTFNQFENKGLIGNKFCVNGKIQPYFQVERRKYRFRLLNASVSRLYEFYLAAGDGMNQTFTYIASDGNLLPNPLLNQRKIPLSPAERADIIVDFSKYPVGTRLYLVNRLIQTDGRGPEGPLVNIRGSDGMLLDGGVQIMRFDIDSDPPVADVSRVPNVLRPLPPISLSEVKKEREFKFDKENDIWTVNGKIFDVEKTVAKVKRGTAEIWRLYGKGNWHHPIHIHLEEFRILWRNGRTPEPHERGRKDVVVLAPGEEVRVFIRFRDHVGKYVMHCHNLIHEDHAMMVRFDVED